MTQRPRFSSRAALCALAVPAILLVAGCGRKSNTVVHNDEGEPAAKAATLVSSLKMSDPSAKVQLTKGVYGLENGAWRWTAGNFTIVLKTPPGAAQKGATLTLHLVTPDSTLKELHSQSLTAAIGPNTLKTEKYSDAGPHTFSADVPAASLTGDTVAIDFSLDNSLPPGPADRRELGIIISAASLDAN